MSTIQSIELFTAINLSIVGLSHFLQPRIWVDFFVFLHSKANAGNIFNGLLALSVGTLVFSFHVVWTWPRILITIYGLAQILKGLLYLLIPSIGINSMARVRPGQEYKFRWVGLIMFLMSLVIFYGLVADQGLNV